MKIRNMLTKKTAVAISAVAVVAFLLVAMGTTVFAADLSDTPSGGGWLAQRARWALWKARHQISHATDVIVEQAADGENVTIAKNTLKASILIYSFAERAFGKERYRASFAIAILSALVAHDSARIALEGPETVDVIVGEVGEKVEEVKEFIDELEESGVDVSLARRVWEYANATHVRAEELVEEEKPVRAVVAAEISRMIAQLAKEVALIAKAFPPLT